MESIYGDCLERVGVKNKNGGYAIIDRCGKPKIGDLALLLEVSRSTVAMWESNKVYPRAERLKKLADLFGCTIDELIRGGK